MRPGTKIRTIYGETKTVMEVNGTTVYVYEAQAVYHTSKVSVIK